MSDECIIRCSYVDGAALCGKPASYPLLGSTYCEVHIGPLKERAARMEAAAYREKLLAHFASAALPRLLTDYDLVNPSSYTLHDWSRRAYDIAKAMLAEHDRAVVIMEAT